MCIAELIYVLCVYVCGRERERENGFYILNNCQVNFGASSESLEL